MQRLETRYARLDDLDSADADSLLSMIGRHRGDLGRARLAVKRVADEVAAVRRTIASYDWRARAARSSTRCAQARPRAS